MAAKLDDCVLCRMIKIAVTGPESTGKTTLAEGLALELQTVWVREFARDYLSKLQHSYSENDLLAITRGQIDLEIQAEPSAKRFLICDTDMLVLKIWSEFKYGRIHPFIQHSYQNRNYDFTFLCGTDLPWEEDPLREHPEKREELYNLYKAELLNTKRDFVELSGSADYRLQVAVNEVKKRFSF
ncbi:MAG: AAA family ATPase [Flavobacteriales bacterium]